MNEPRMIKYPPEIPQEDMELFLKEWKLAGYEIEGAGSIVAGMEPNPPKLRFIYQKLNGAWHWIDTSNIQKVVDALVSRLKEARSFGATGPVSPGGGATYHHGDSGIRPWKKKRGK